MNDEYKRSMQLDLTTHQQRRTYLETLNYHVMIITSDIYILKVKGDGVDDLLDMLVYVV